MEEILTQQYKYAKGAQFMGSVGHWEFIERGIKGTSANNMSFKVEVYSDHIVKVHISQNSLFDEQSYAVIATPTDSHYDVTESEELIQLTTSAIKLEIDKSNTTFSFFQPNGTPILEDDPYFGTSWLGEQVTCYKKLQKDERFIGLGEKTGPLDRRGQGYQNWNTDHFGYPLESDPLYCSTPFYIGIHSGLSYGMYFDNSHKSHFNFGASNRRFSSFSADQGDMCYYLIHHKEVKDIISSYTYLTGRMHLPPLWSLGYQQCRYSYRPDKQVINIAKTFRDKGIPADVIVLDIHYMEQYKIFTWDNKDFPNPKALVQQLEDMGFKVVVILDPGIKIEKGYLPYDTGVDDDVFIKYPDDTYYEGEVWPGWCHFPDFTNPTTRAWWQQLMKSYTDLGISGYWNDMNEIATWGQTLPELIEFCFEDNKGTMRKARNIYGMQMARSTYNGARYNFENKRVFNLTRAGFSGVQRYAAVWTGDNVADDEHMLLGVRLVNSLGLTGVAFAGYDVGGFAGNADEKLFARWIAIGAFSPFFRGHSMINSKNSEPWAYGEEVEEISANYIKLRYKLMPYIYSTFYEASKVGIPICRSLAIDYTFDDKIYDQNFQNQYLFGQSILVAPVPSKFTFSNVYLPEGIWYDMFTDAKYDGKQEIIAKCPIERLPVFVKASAIIPLQNTADSLSQNNNKCLQIHIYNGIESNSYTYYEDDGTTHQHEKGDFYLRTIEFNPLNKKLALLPTKGTYRTQYEYLKIYFHGLEKATKIIKVQEKNVKVQYTDFRHLDPISDFDPSMTQNHCSLQINQLPYIEIPNTDDTIQISW